MKQSVCIMDNGMSQGFWILLTLLTFHLPITEIHIQPVVTCESGDLVPRRWHCWWDACTTWRSQVRPNGWKLKGFRFRGISWSYFKNTNGGYNLYNDVFYDVVRCTYQNTLELSGVLVKLWKAQGHEICKINQNMTYQKSKHIRTYWSTVIIRCQGKLISWHISVFVRIQRCPKWLDCLRAEGSFLEDRAGNSKSHVGFQFTGVAQMKYDEVLLC